VSTEEKEDFYAKEFFDFMAARASNTGGGGWLNHDDHVAVNELQRQRRMVYIKEHLPQPGGRILDIGCSSGFMLYPLAEMGYECIGIEPAEASAKYVRSRGIDCYHDITSLQTENVQFEGFDLIIHFFVADQTADIYEFINKQLTMLVPGGKIIFEINSTDDPMLSLYKLPAFDEFYWTVAQNFYFSQISFDFFLKMFHLSYEIMLDQRYDLSNHIVWASNGKPGGMGRFTKTLGAEIEDAYRQALVKAGRCDTLVGILTQS